jgi:serine/threonine-protein kinase RsbT
MILTREVVALGRSEDVLRARQVARALSLEVGFGLVDQTKIVTAVSELARNTVIHGGGGTATLEVVENGARRGLRIVFRDEGLGIADVEQALRDGYTTGDGLGLGLGGARRLMNEFEIVSAPGKGTTITIARWK